MPDVATVSAASKQRLILKEQFLAKDRRREIEDALGSSPERFMWHIWHSCYSQGIIQPIFQGQDENRRNCINKRDILKNIGGSRGDSSSRRHELQRTVIRMMDKLLPSRP
ncbi:MAG: hypothetical protein ACKPKO_20845, partial [Candidatus Fonsibacter sp.]